MCWIILKGDTRQVIIESKEYKMKIISDSKRYVVKKCGRMRIKSSLSFLAFESCLRKSEENVEIIINGATFKIYELI